MGETTKAESTKPSQQQQHLQQTTQLISSSSSPKESLDHQETPPSQLHHLHHHYHHRQPFISSPLYIPIAAVGSSPAAINPKRPRYGSPSAPPPQWKTLPSPSSLEPPKQAQMVVFTGDASTNPISSPPSTSTNPTLPQPSSAAAGSSSETAGSSPTRSPALSSFAVGQEQITSKPETEAPLPQFRKGKYVSPVWKPNEMLWLARAWRVQYQLGGGGGGAISGENQETGQPGRGKTRAEKDREVAEFLNRHGINRDAKTAGTKWDNMLGEFRKVYEWERGGERERFGKSYFRLSPYERKQNRLPASFDEEVFEELAQFMGPRMRAPVSRGGVVPPLPPSSMMIPADLDVVRLPLPPPFPTLRDHDDVPTHPAGRTIGDHYPQFQHLHGTRGTGIFSTSSSTLYDPSMEATIQHCSSSSSRFKELRRIGKIRVTWEESVSLWAEEGEIQRGRIRVKGLSFLNAEELLYFDDSLVACSMEAFEDGPLKGFSVDRFLSGQQVKVFGRKKSTSSASSSSAIIPTREFQDLSEHYLSNLRVSPGALPSLFELSWYLQEPPPKDLRFPLRKDVYKDLPPGKELFFTISSTEPPVDCRAITYDIVSSIITTRISNPNFIISSRDSMIPLWDDCVNRIVSKFCPTEMVIVRKPSSSSSSSQESVQDQWPNVLGFIKGFGLWRGEESDHTKEGEAAGPSSLILEKLLWSYINLPYVLGYYAVGFTVTFCALSRTQDHRIICTDLYSFDASSPSARIKALVPCYRLSCLLPLLADRCINGGSISDKTGSDHDNNNNMQFCYSDFERIDHGDHITEVTPNTVTKHYTTKRKWTAVKEIYDFLELRIPHAEHLHRANENDLSLTFKPRGVKVKPWSVDQLVESLMCVTKALVALHDLSFMHRDLGWDKVMMLMVRAVDRSTDTAAEETTESEWFLCGFEEARDAPHLNPHATAVAAAATAEERGRYAPEMGRGLHGVKVDVWGIGYMIKTCGLIGVPKMLRELQSKCLEPNPEQRPTAADCYHHLLQVQSAMAPPY